MAYLLYGVKGAGMGEVSLYLCTVNSGGTGNGMKNSSRGYRARAIIVERWSSIITNGISQLWVQSLLGRVDSPKNKIIQLQQSQSNKNSTIKHFRR